MSETPALPSDIVRIPGVSALVIMGVSGSGKSTIGAALARRLRWRYADGDSFHSEANVAKMRVGSPLTDADREPWLRSIAAWIDACVAQDDPGVVACSALRRRYREILTDGGRRAGARVIYLKGEGGLIAERMARRRGHYMPTSLLDSQLATLEEPTAEEGVIAVGIARPPEEIAEQILRRLRPPS